MTAAFIDTSVLVAAMIEAEAGHVASRKLIAGGGMGMYAHGIAETFSTLTGGRKPFRMAAESAHGLLEDHFVPRLEITSLTSSETLRAMRDCSSRGVRGGAVFDYLHLIAARKAKTARIYTLNLAHFRAFHRPGDPEIVHP